MSEGWSREELQASVVAYLEMQSKQRAGESYVKKRYYEDLASRFGRTEKSWEFRMQNISSVMELHGRNWLPGLKPKRNVGSKVLGDLEELIGTVEGRSLPKFAAFEASIREHLRQSTKYKTDGNKKPLLTTTHISQHERDPSVKAWVLLNANGICECFSKSAPFCKADGTQFLEGHHVRQLAEHGSDTITNTVALCPNCHREIHYGERMLEMVESLYLNVTRLERE